MVYSFEAVGRNKKESEELASSAAVTVLHNTNIISSSGKLLCELNTHKTLQSNSIISDIHQKDESLSDSQSLSKEGF